MSPDHAVPTFRIVLLAMPQTFQLFVLQKCLPLSYTYVGDLLEVVETPSTENLESLEESVQGFVRSRPEFKFLGEDIDDVSFVVYQVRRQWIPIEPLNRGSLASYP